MSNTAAGLLQVALLLTVLIAVYKPLGDYMARVYTAKTHLRAERVTYRLVRVHPDADQGWTTYAVGVLGLSAVSIVFLYLLQRLQSWLPLSLARGAVEPGIAFNTAVSFVTNTNWQSYVPESVMGHLVQLAGLTVLNFGGVAMSLRAGVAVTGLDGSSSTIALAPTASQEAIKELGTNGGGIFNANSAHPFENPNGLSNLLEIFLLLVIPVCLTRAFGVMVRDTRQGHVLLAVMGVLWGGLLTVAWWAETHPNGPAALLAGGAAEGKEVRFDIPSSVLFAVSTTGTSTGAVNSLHDSYTGLGGGVVLLNMLLGEVAPGGVGAGLYGILVIAIIAVFLAGLMVGRTPEYLGKKLGRVEVTTAAISLLTMPMLVLIGAGLAIAFPGTPDALNNPGMHGFSE